MQRHLKLVAAGGWDDAQNVEAAGWRASSGQAPKITPRNRHDVPLLAHRHGSGGRRKAGVGPGLHFDETQDVLIPSDQIDFAAIMGNAEIRRHESVAQALQMKERLGLAALAQSEMLGSAGTASAAKPAQRADDELSEPCHADSNPVAAVTLVFHCRPACDCGHATVVSR